MKISIKIFTGLLCLDIKGNIILSMMPEGITKYAVYPAMKLGIKLELYRIIDEE